MAAGGCCFPGTIDFELRGGVSRRWTVALADHHSLFEANGDLRRVSNRFVFVLYLSGISLLRVKVHGMNEPLTPQESMSPVPAEPIPMAPPEADGSVAGELEDISDAQVEALTAAAPPAATVPPSGTELHGRIVGIVGDGVFVDVGLRSQALVPTAQFDDGFRPEVGREIDVVVVRLDPSTDLVRANLKGAVVAPDVNSLMVGVIVNCKITGMIKGGLEVQLGSARAFMPASHVDTMRVKDISIYLNQMVLCQVIEMDKRGKSIIVSRRKALEKERADTRQRLLDELEVGQLLKGIVRNLTDYGAFVDLGGVHGLCHVSDMRWTPVEKPGDVVKEGDEVEVRVLKINKQRDRISLGLKQATPDPWSNVEDQYPTGMRLKVPIVKLAEFGAFVEVAEGLTGLIPLTEMSWSHRPGNPGEVVSLGQTVDVVVLNVSAKRRRIALSMKQITEDPWKTFAGALSPNSVITGRVTKLLDFGVLVKLEEGIEGMVHISELAPQRVRTPGDVVNAGDEITVKVLSVDSQKRRIALSLKATTEKPDEHKADDPAPSPAKTNRKKPLRGGLSSHFDW